MDALFLKLKFHKLPGIIINLADLSYKVGPDCAAHAVL